MKVIFVNRYYSPDESATSRMVTSLARSLTARGFAVTVLTGQRLHNDPKVTLPPSEVIEGVSVRRIWTSGFGRGQLIGRALDYLTFHLDAFAYLLRHLRSKDVCVVCTDPPLLSVTALLPTALRGAFLVNWIMDLFPEVAIDLGLMRRGSRPASFVTWIRDVSLHRAWMTVAPIGRMADFLRDRGIPSSKLAVVHHWSDGNSLRPMDLSQSSLRDEWGLSDRFVVGYSGNLGRAHEFGTLLDAAEQLAPDRRIVFLFVGGGYRRAWVEEEVRRRGLPNVVFKPLQPVERLAESLAAADVHVVSLLPEMEPYIVPSKFYGIAAAGRSVLFIGDLDGEIAQVLRRAMCGTSVPIGRGSELAGVIRSLSSDPARCREEGERARRVFETEFTEATGVTHWSTLLRATNARSVASESEVASAVPPVVRG